MRHTLSGQVLVDFRIHRLECVEDCLGGSRGIRAIALGDAGHVGWHGVAQQGPVNALEERVRFDLLCTSLGAQALAGISDQQLGNQVLSMTDENVCQRGCVGNHQGNA
jgi:hypothetical protein